MIFNFTLEDLKRNLDKFSVWAKAKLLSDSALALFLCS